MGIDTTILREFAENAALRNHLKAELDEANAERDRLQEIIVKMYSSEGVQSQKVKLDGGFRTIYLRRELWAGHNGDGPAALCEALKVSGYESYVKENFNTQSLSSLVRELGAQYHNKPDVSELTVEEILEGVPEDMRICMKVNELFKVGMRAT